MIAPFTAEIWTAERRQNLQAFRNGDIELLISTALLLEDSMSTISTGHQLSLAERVGKLSPSRRSHCSRRAEDGHRLVTNRNKNLINRISERGSTI